MSDPVNHPDHYTQGAFECIDAMLDTQGVEAVQNYCICNAFKYIWRHNLKNNDQDIRKAKWYIDKYLELANKSDNEPDKNLFKIDPDGTKWYFGTSPDASKKLVDHD